MSGKPRPGLPPVVKRVDRAGLLTEGSVAGSAFPALRPVARWNRGSPITVTGSWGIRTPFPFHPEFGAPDRMSPDRRPASAGGQAPSIPALMEAAPNADAGDYLSTATFTEKAGKTILTLHERHPWKASLDEALASGVSEGTCETYDQLDELLASTAKIS